jgi:hypothetical protein
VPFQDRVLAQTPSPCNSCPVANFSAASLEHSEGWKGLARRVPIHERVRYLLRKLRRLFT